MYSNPGSAQVPVEAYPKCFTELYIASEARDFGLSLCEFAEALIQVGNVHAPAVATRSQAVEFYRRLHLRDFALAQACSKGNALAWDRFITEFRPRICATALSIARNEQLGRDLADSLWGDLFSITDDTRSRWTKFTSYTGRGSLDSWIRAILTHRYLDHCRAQQRVVSLESHPGFLKALAINQERERIAPDPRLAEAVHEAISNCSAQERYLLAAYFFDGQTLADQARSNPKC